MNASKSTFARAAVGAAVTFVVLDAVWIVWVAAPMFREAFGTALLETPRLAPAAAFYVLYPIGLAHLAIRPALRQASLRSALGSGAVAGALAYGTFDLTNLALLQSYNVSLALADWGWGTLVSALASAAGYVLAQRGGRG